MSIHPLAAWIGVTAIAGVFVGACSAGGDSNGNVTGASGAAGQVAQTAGTGAAPPQPSAGAGGNLSSSSQGGMTITSTGPGVTGVAGVATSSGGAGGAPTMVIGSGGAAGAGMVPSTAGGSPGIPGRDAHRYEHAAVGNVVSGSSRRCTDECSAGSHDRQPDPTRRRSGLHDLGVRTRAIGDCALQLRSRERQ